MALEFQGEPRVQLRTFDLVSNRRETKKKNKKTKKKNERRGVDHARRHRKKVDREAADT